MVIIVTFLIGCKGGEMAEKITQLPKIKDISPSSWKKLSEKKIYFGHHSVGFNIVQGIKDLLKENPQIKLRVIETHDTDEFNTYIFAHSKVGKNYDPRSKIDEFAAFMEEGIGEKVDIAFFKFCVVDIDASTEVRRLFTDYKKKMSWLKNKYPESKFVHVTVPLIERKFTAFRSWINKLLGKKSILDDDHNIARNEFNELLRKEYDGNEPVFDLAKIESIYPDGRRAEFERNGERYYSLVPAYTHDGAHLNETGRKKIAEQLLIFLANLSQ